MRRNQLIRLSDILPSPLVGEGRLVVATLCAGLAGLFATAALAGTTVTLKASPTARGADVTLGDLFAGAPATAAKVALMKAPLAGANAVIEASRVQAVARAAGLDWDNAQGMRRVVVAAAGSPEAATKARRPQALAYARNIAAGEMVDAADLVWSDEAVAPADAPGDAEHVIGQAARRPLRAGAAVGAHDVSPPKVIKHDEIIAVSFQAEGIRLTLQGKAMGDAAVGDLVQVQNPQSKKMLQAVVTGPGEATVGPRAEALRAQPYRTALR